MENAERIIRHIVKPGMRCVDVGANVGIMSAAMLDCAGSGGSVMAFEPMPKWHNQLVSLKKTHTNFTAEMCALSNMPSEGWKVTEDRNNIGNGGLTFFSGDEPTRVSTLDLEMRGAGVDFIKIDVEGMELEVIMGAWRTITRSRPVLVYESHPEFCEARQQPVLKWIALILSNAGYNLYDLKEGGLVGVISDTAGRDTIAMPS